MTHPSAASVTYSYASNCHPSHNPGEEALFLNCQTMRGQAGPGFFMKLPFTLVWACDSHKLGQDHLEHARKHLQTELSSK